jgi:hypothetical protein
MIPLPDLTPFGLNYTGRCACPGRPHRWRGNNYELKYWDGRNVWRLIRSGKVVRYGKDFNSVYDEIKEYYASLAG